MQFKSHKNIMRGMISLAYSDYAMYNDKPG